MGSLPSGRTRHLLRWRADAFLRCGLDNDAPEHNRDSAEEIPLVTGEPVASPAEKQVHQQPDLHGTRQLREVRVHSRNPSQISSYAPKVPRDAYDERHDDDETDRAQLLEHLRVEV